ncbi:MAG: hypothetical protein ACXWQO_10535 [Bdellovibrionota bacterium]
MKTLTLLAAAAILLTAVAARADSNIKSGEILSALIAAAPNAVLIDEQGKNADLSEALGNALAVDSVSAQNGKATIINSVSGECNSTDVDKYGMAYYDCWISIMDGDYTKTKTGFTGPTLESSRTFLFNATKKIGDEGKLRLEGKKVRIMNAG